MADHKTYTDEEVVKGSGPFKNRRYIRVNGQLQRVHAVGRGLKRSIATPPAAPEIQRLRGPKSIGRVDLANKGYQEA